MKFAIKFISLSLVLIFSTIVNADIDQYSINYYIPVYISPNIISWSNNLTNDNSLNISTIIGQSIKFNISADQNIDRWLWKKDGNIQSNNYDNFTTSWLTTGNKIITANGTNINGTTNTIVWTIMVGQNQNQTLLGSCGNLNKSNTVYVLNSNVTASGTCFTVGANNITLDGQGNNVNYASSVTGYGINDVGGYGNIIIRNVTLSQQNSAVSNAHGIYLKNVLNSKADNIKINTKNNGKGLYLTSSGSNTFSNITIGTLNNGAYGIYMASSNSNYFSACTISTTGGNSDGIYMISSNSNSFSVCNISTAGGNSDGIYMTSSSYNNYSGSILTSGTGANGVWINNNGNFNNFLNSNILASASGIRLNSVGFNIIRDGSIMSKSVNDYYLQNSNTNNFINTNFTTRKIYFNDNNSSFNYANFGIMVNTTQIISPTKVLTITRTLSHWDQTNISWTDKVSAARTINYGIRGLIPNSVYSVWNGSIIDYNLTVDSNGNLPNFNISFSTLAKIIKVTQK